MSEASRRTSLIKVFIFASHSRDDHPVLWHPIPLTSPFYILHRILCRRVRGPRSTRMLLRVRRLIHPESSRSSRLFFGRIRRVSMLGVYLPPLVWHACAEEWEAAWHHS